MTDYTWYASKSNATSPDTIHQILMFGSLEDIRELKNEIREEKLRR